MKKITVIFSLILIASLVLTACGAPEPVVPDTNKNPQECADLGVEFAASLVVTQIEGGFNYKLKYVCSRNFPKGVDQMEYLQEKFSFIFWRYNSDFQEEVPLTWVNDYAEGSVPVDVAQITTVKFLFGGAGLTHDKVTGGYNIYDR